MSIFEKTTADQEKFNQFSIFADNKLNDLAELSDCVNTSELARIKKSFDEKIKDFYRSDRKLNIGIIGMVKAGKSTFLNTLLFGGNEVLPAAITPKTATLTKIEYSETNKIIIEYYSPQEWDELRNLANNGTNTVAAEIMRMAENNTDDPYYYINKGRDEIEFQSQNELMGKLNMYVGENGSVTPVVKNVTICIDSPELQEISVVDTPGMNDAIASRTDKTREFIEKCDVVFFLSKASRFLPKDDMELLVTQLPQKGVSNMVLIASQFDMTILDILDDTESLTEAIAYIRKKLSNSAKKEFSEIMEKCSENTAKVLKNCTDPVPVSSWACNIYHKNKSEYTEKDEELYDSINQYGDLTSELLNEIGNFDSVRSQFYKIVSEKDKTLSEKSKSFIPNVHNEWNETVKRLEEDALRRKNLLESGDKEALAKQKNAMERQISGIKASLEKEVFGKLICELERSKTDNMKSIRDRCIELGKLKERTGQEWHEATRRVGGFSVFGLFTIGGHKERYSYSTNYTYLAASDALEGIRTFGYETCSDIETAFHRAVDIKATKQKLINIVLDNMDTGDENFDVNHFRFLIETVLNRIEMPEMKIDIAPFLNRISSRFTGEVTNSVERSNLQNLLSETLDSMLKDIEQKFGKAVTDFRKKIDSIQNNFEDELLKEIRDEYDILRKQFDNKEAEISRYDQAINVLNSSLIS